MPPIANSAFYVAIDADLEDHHDVRGIWAGIDGQGASAECRISVLTEIKKRGVGDVFFTVYDCLKVPDSVNAVFLQVKIQACIIHPIRRTFRYAPHN